MIENFAGSGPTSPTLEQPPSCSVPLSTRQGRGLPPNRVDPELLVKVRHPVLRRGAPATRSRTPTHNSRRRGGLRRAQARAGTTISSKYAVRDNGRRAWTRPSWKRSRRISFIDRQPADGRRKGSRHRSRDSFGIFSPGARWPSSISNPPPTEGTCVRFLLPRA